MKKILTVLLMMSLLVCMTGCASQSDLDAAIVERDALQAKVDQYSDIIDALDAEEYEAAMNIISQKQIAKEMEEKGDIEDYLVTVDLTLDNFGDYFEWKSYYGINEFGEEEECDLWFPLVSKVYDEGLVLYKADVKLGITMSMTYDGNYGTNSYSTEDTLEWEEHIMPTRGSSTSSEDRYILDKCNVTTTRVEGTVIFVKEDYVVNYDLGEVRNGWFQDAKITLVNGEELFHSVQFEDKY